MGDKNYCTLTIKRVPRFDFHIGFILSYIFGFLLFLYTIYPGFLQLPCPIKSTLAIPCLTCGSSRCITSLLHADFLTAFASNPMVVVTTGLSTLLIGLSFLQIISHRRICIQFPRITDTQIKYGLFALIIINYFYLLLLQI